MLTLSSLFSDGHFLLSVQLPLRPCSSSRSPPACSVTPRPSASRAVAAQPGLPPGATGPDLPQRALAHRGCWSTACDLLGMWCSRAVAVAGALAQADKLWLGATRLLWPSLASAEAQPRSGFWVVRACLRSGGSSDCTSMVLGPDQRRRGHLACRARVCPVGLLDEGSEREAEERKAG